MATYTWNGGNGNFVDGSKWTTGTLTGIAPGQGDTAFVSNSGSFLIAVDTLSNVGTLASLYFGAPQGILSVSGGLGAGLQLAAGTLEIVGSGIVTVAGDRVFSGGTLVLATDSSGRGNQEIDARGTLTLGPSLTVMELGDSIVFDQALVNQAAFTIGNVSTGYQRLTVETGSFYDSGAITVFGRGILGVDGAYTVAGRTSIKSGGYLALNGVLPTFTGTGQITLDAGATLQGNFGTTFNAIAAQLSRPGWNIAPGVILDELDSINNVGNGISLGLGSGLFGTVYLQAGTLTGGTVFAGPNLIAGNTLSAVTVLGTVNSFLVDDRSTFLAADGVGQGVIIGGELRLTNGTVLRNAVYRPGVSSGFFGVVGAASVGTIGPGGTIDVAGTTMGFEIAIGTLINQGLLIGEAGSLSTINVDSIGLTNANTGLVSIVNGETFSLLTAASLVNAGSIFIGSGASFLAGGAVVGPEIVSTGLVTIDNATALLNAKVTGGGTFIVADGGVLNFQQGLDASGTLPALAFGAGTGSSIAYAGGTGFTPTIANFAAGDMVDLLNFDSTAFTATTTSLVVGAGTNAATLRFATPFATVPSFTVQDIPAVHTTVITAAVCYAAGTRILTESGERPIERLRVGDRVVTVLGRSGLAPVRWIGRQTIDLDRHPTPKKIAPIRVRANSFGPGRPHRDLILSPEHAVLVDGVLVPIRCLVDDDGIAMLDVPRITYLHLELSRHDLILAEGLAAESWLDTGNRAMFANVATPMLHPDFTPDPHRFQTGACLRVIAGGLELADIRARRAGAAPLGTATSDGTCWDIMSPVRS